MWMKWLVCSRACLKPFPRTKTSHTAVWWLHRRQMAQHLRMAQLMEAQPATLRILWGGKCIQKGHETLLKQLWNVSKLYTLLHVVSKVSSLMIWDSLGNLGVIEIVWCHSEPFWWFRHASSIFFHAFFVCCRPCLEGWNYFMGRQWFWGWDPRRNDRLSMEGTR